MKEALREVEREQKRVGFAERPTDMEYLKNTCVALRRQSCFLANRSQSTLLCCSANVPSSQLHVRTTSFAI